jgi:beta-lactam-binding protein with PASTA domain
VRQRFLLVLATLAAALCAGASAAPPEPMPTVVPNVVGLRMDRATRTLRSRGLRAHETCAGVFGCIFRARWWVCLQSPRAGQPVARSSVVVIYAERRGEC